MAIPKPKPGDWIRENAQQLKVTDKQILQMLRDSSKRVHAELKRLDGAQGKSDAIRRAQLNASKAYLLAEQAKLFRQLGDVISVRRVEGAVRAQRLSMATDNALLELVGKGAEAEYFYQSMLQTSQNAIDAALARMRLSARPLSQRIYDTGVWMNGRLNRLINETLATGLNAREFAKAARDWFSPNTPGGVRYAALRLARTEINNTFHAMTAERARQSPWTPNCKWHLSGSHVKPDDCDRLAKLNDGIYPSDEVPGRPHPQCMCFITPDPVDEDEFIENFLNGDYDDYIDREMANARQVNVGPGAETERELSGSGSGGAVLSQIERQPTFESRREAAAKERDALNAPRFGLERKVRDPEFTPEMRTAVNRYSGMDYQGINNYLRDRRFGITKQGQGYIDNLDATMRESKLAREIYTYRGIQDASEIFGKQLSSDLTGMEWKEDAFVSTSALERRSAAFLGSGRTPMMMRILTPAGVGAVEVSPEGAEAEILLERGRALRIVKDHGINPDGVRVVDVELL